MKLLRIVFRNVWDDVEIKQNFKRETELENFVMWYPKEPVSHPSLRIIRLCITVVLYQI